MGLTILNVSTQTVEPSEKTLAHELIDSMGPEQLGAAVSYLQSIVDDPVLRALAQAPMDDEELKPEVAASIDEGIDETEGLMDHDEVFRQLGL